MGITRRAMLFSGLVCPGLGQWVLGRRFRGALIIAWILLLALAMFLRLFFLVHDSIYPFLADLKFPPPEVISEMHKQAYLENWWILALIIAIWLGSIIDAYRIGRLMEAALPEIDQELRG